MPVSPSFRDFVLDQLGRVAPVKARSMFGGVGVYSEALFFAVLDDDVLYLKVDEGTREGYRAAGCFAFDPFKNGQPMDGYWSLPGEVLEDEEALGPWVRAALAVAARAAAKKPKKGKARR